MAPTSPEAAKFCKAIKRVSGLKTNDRSAKSLHAARSAQSISSQSVSIRSHPWLNGSPETFAAPFPSNSLYAESFAGQPMELLHGGAFAQSRRVRRSAGRDRAPRRDGAGTGG